MRGLLSKIQHSKRNLTETDEAGSSIMTASICSGELRGTSNHTQLKLYACMGDEDDDDSVGSLHLSCASMSEDEDTTVQTTPLSSSGKDGTKSQQRRWLQKLASKTKPRAWLPQPQQPEKSAPLDVPADTAKKGEEECSDSTHSGGSSSSSLQRGEGDDDAASIVEDQGKQGPEKESVSPVPDKDGGECEPSVRKSNSELEFAASPKPAPNGTPMPTPSKSKSSKSPKERSKSRTKDKSKSSSRKESSGGKSKSKSKTSKKENKSTELPESPAEASSDFEMPVVAQKTQVARTASEGSAPESTTDVQDGATTDAAAANDTADDSADDAKPASITDNTEPEQTPRSRRRQNKASLPSSVKGFFSKMHPSKRNLSDLDDATACSSLSERRGSHHAPLKLYACMDEDEGSSSLFLSSGSMDEEEDSKPEATTTPLSSQSNHKGNNNNGTNSQKRWLKKIANTTKSARSWLQQQSQQQDQSPHRDRGTTPEEQEADTNSGGSVSSLNRAEDEDSASLAEAHPATSERNVSPTRDCVGCEAHLRSSNHDFTGHLQLEFVASPKPPPRETVSRSKSPMGTSQSKSKEKSKSGKESSSKTKSIDSLPTENPLCDASSDENVAPGGEPAESSNASGDANANNDAPCSSSDEAPRSRRRQNKAGMRKRGTSATPPTRSGSDEIMSRSSRRLAVVKKDATAVVQVDEEAVDVVEDAVKISSKKKSNKSAGSRTSAARSLSPLQGAPEREERRKCRSGIQKYRNDAKQGMLSTSNHSSASMSSRTVSRSRRGRRSSLDMAASEHSRRKNRRSSDEGFGERSLRGQRRSLILEDDVASKSERVADRSSLSLDDFEKTSKTERSSRSIRLNDSTASLEDSFGVERLTKSASSLDDSVKFEKSSRRMRSLGHLEDGAKADRSSRRTRTITDENAKSERSMRRNRTVSEMDDSAKSEKSSRKSRSMSSMDDSVKGEKSSRKSRSILNDPAAIKSDKSSRKSRSIALEDGKSKSSRKSRRSSLDLNADTAATNDKSRRQRRSTMQHV